MSETAHASRTKLTGICPAARAYALARVMQAQTASVWLVVLEEARAAEALSEDLALFLDQSGFPAGSSFIVFPETQADHRDVREAFNAASDRLAVLSLLRSRKPAGRVPSPAGDGAAPAESRPPTAPLIIFS
ncbi:MAG: hypothetical protein ACHQ5A_13275, partial [Opitutales bacterium]